MLSVSLKLPDTLTSLQRDLDHTPGFLRGTGVSDVASTRQASVIRPCLWLAYFTPNIHVRTHTGCTTQQCCSFFPIASRTRDDQSPLFYVPFRTCARRGSSVPSCRLEGRGQYNGETLTPIPIPIFAIGGLRPPCSRVRDTRHRRQHRIDPLHHCSYPRADSYLGASSIGFRFAPPHTQARGHGQSRPCRGFILLNSARIFVPALGFHDGQTLVKLR
ncbi:hypothetical protein C8R46DRAFT_610573 [Mycena filopes]|nr:hypothetical protein C8R46DRAFT_610573 [Mycena filopes]